MSSAPTGVSDTNNKKYLSFFQIPCTIKIMRFLKIGVIVIALLLLMLFVVPKFLLFALLSPQGTVNPSDLTGVYDGSKKTAMYNNKSMRCPAPVDVKIEPKKVVLGDSTGSKRIEIDLTRQRVYAYEGDRKIYDFLISSGKWGRTPTGRFRIWVKLRYALMTGGSSALGTYYYLPNVPFTMYFYNEEVSQTRGFSLHGTYWHSNFGHPMSHGCINMKTEDVALLYYWAKPELPASNSSIVASRDNPGTEIVIYGNAPYE